jgi:hypothetical protein
MPTLRLLLGRPRRTFFSTTAAFFGGIFLLAREKSDGVVLVLTASLHGRDLRTIIERKGMGKYYHIRKRYTASVTGSTSTTSFSTCQSTTTQLEMNFHIVLYLYLLISWSIAQTITTIDP